MVACREPEAGSSFERESYSVSRKLLLLLLITAALLSDPVSGQSQAPLPESTLIHAVRVDRAPTLDGSLDDPLWQEAEVTSNFRQKEPYEGEPATERTDVRVLYTHRAVYFGIHCFDSEPSKIIANELRRDVSQDLDDHFEILIDSNHDRRGAYVFQINPLGTQIDGLIVEEQGSTSGGDFDPGWDGVWSSSASPLPSISTRMSSSPSASTTLPATSSPTAPARIAASPTTSSSVLGAITTALSTNSASAPTTAPTKNSLSPSPRRGTVFACPFPTAISPSFSPASRPTIHSTASSPSPASSRWTLRTHKRSVPIFASAGTTVRTATSTSSTTSAPSSPASPPPTHPRSAKPASP